MKRAVDSDDGRPGPAAATDAAGKKRRLRRGRRKSKAERLARALAPSAAGVEAVAAVNAESTTDGEAAALAALAALRSLLADPRSSTSSEWDRAQNLALRLDSPAARESVVEALLWAKRAPKAAAHYAKRLRVREPEALRVLERRLSAPPEGGDSSADALAAAKFLAELGEDVVSSPERLRRFLWPWLQRARQRLPPAAARAADDDTEAVPAADLAVVAARRERSAFRAAVHLLLHSLPPAEHDGAKASKVADKRARSETLRRLLVRECLVRGRFLYLVPAYAASGFASVDRSLLERHACSSDGHGQSAVAAASDGLESRRQLAARIEHALRMIWPDCSVEPFGSSATGLLLPPDPGDTGEAAAEQDDLDLCVVVPSSPAVRRETAPLAVEMKEHLALYLPELGELLAIEGARVPIAVGSAAGVKCELSVNNVAAVWNTRLVRWLLTRGPEVAVGSASAGRLAESIRRFCLWLKHWRRAKKRTVGASLSSHGLLLLALYFLQQQGLLPAVDCSEAAAASEDALGAFSVAAVDRFLAEMPSPEVKCVAGDANDPRVCWWTLVQRFFRFYTAEFDYEHAVVSLRTSAVVTKTHRRWTRVAWTAVVSIEDPVEVTRDLGMLFTRKTFGKLRCAFAHACSVFFFLPSGAEVADQAAALMAVQPFEVTRDGERGRRPGDDDAMGSGDDGDSEDGEDGEAQGEHVSTQVPATGGGILGPTAARK